MRLRKIALGMLAAVATFTFAICVYTSVRAAASLVSRLTARSAAADLVTPKGETPAAPVLVEPVFLGPSTDAEIAPDKQNYEEYDWTGYYYSNSETLPKAFSDISYIELETREYSEDGNNKAIPPDGTIRTNTILEFTHIAIGGKEIAFQTATVDGVSYKFTGRFLSQGSCDRSDDRPVLKGRLIKIKGSKWAAEMEAEFSVTCGC